MSLSPGLILGIIALYFALLLVVSHFTSRDQRNDMFFLAGRRSPWFVVAFGMIGASLSGVTFISIPGVVGGDGQNMAFSYMQMVFGYLLGYAAIALVLLPLYYRLQLTSIYSYLEQRFGLMSYKTGAAFFLLSRTIGAAFRLFLVAIVLYEFVLGPMGIPFWLTVVATIVLIWIYTFRGGIHTIVWTDTLQTVCMLGAVLLTIWAISQELGGGIGSLVQQVTDSDYSQVFFFERGWSDPNNFFKQFLSGALITIVMTGLDQDMMQKNLSCRNLRDAQKNMFSFSAILVVANLIFLTLGASLYLYAASLGLEIPERTDRLYPMLALEHLPPVIGITFILGLIAAAYSSADSALTALTTSFCVDFLNFEKKPDQPGQKRTRTMVHLSFSLILLAIILVFNAISNTAVINGLFLAAGYTYGPLLGLFVFGIFTNLHVYDKWVLPVCLAAPIISYIINLNAASWLGGFELGFLILALNGLLTIIGLWVISYKVR